MLWLYRILYLPALLVMSPAYLRRMRKRGGYGGKFTQRFGAHDGLSAKRPGVRRVWLQAVSVGEVLAIAPLIEALTSAGHSTGSGPERSRAGNVEIYLTTTTSTGYRLALERYGKVTIGIGYFPLDWWLFSQRAWRKITPDLVILTEGERWPEHIHQAAMRGVPVVCINARLSDRSYRRLRAWRGAARLTLDGITRLLPSSAQDESRFLELGFPRERLQTTGSIKLDVTIPPLTEAEKSQLRRELGLPAGLVLMGSSTWPGEEAALLDALRLVRGRGEACSLLIVPRHAERRPEIEQLMAASGLRFHFRTSGAATGEMDVAVADTTGEMRRLLQLADLVFVGKSLPPHTEGQTPVEAAALEKPILFGPGMGNFRLIARDLISRGAAIEVADAAALGARAAELLPDASRRAELAAAAGQWHRENAGAVDRTLTVIRAELAKLG